MSENLAGLNPDDAPIEMEYEVIEEDESEDPNAVEAAVAELKARAEAKKIEYQEQRGPGGELFFTLLLPSGREKRRFSTYSIRSLQALLAIPFEKYVFLGSYEAICSYEDSMIEASIRSLGPSGYWLLRRLWGSSTSEAAEDSPLVLNDPSGSGLRIKIGPPSADLESLTKRTARLALRLENVTVAQYDQALALLERIANSAFFEIDLRYNVALSIQRARPASRPVRASRGLQEAGEVQFPRSEYDAEPMSLYWYARSATGMPLLQYLAYYQVLEFYFPVYAEREAHQRVKNILRNPRFDPHSDADVGRVVSVLQQGRSRFGDERSQLKNTVQNCVNAQELAEFISRDETRKEFLSKDKVLRAHRISINNREADLPSEVASRIYDLRCKIVHTKNEDAAGELALLLPFSTEAESMHHDIDLIRYVAREVLIANSRPFRS
jgi:hypothetical protein